MKTKYSLVLFVLLTLFSSVLWSEEDGVPSNLPEATKLEFERLEAQIRKQQEEYQKRPKRKFIGTQTKDIQFTDYIDKWSQKVEKVGNENYSLEAKNNKLYGSLNVTVSIKSDGELEGIQINKSSGYKVLDENVLDTIRKSAPFEPFSDEMKKEADILSINRTWTFTHGSGF
jgi:periplasmic protein TonB